MVEDKREPNITVSRRALVRGAIGAAGLGGLGVALSRLRSVDVESLRTRLPGLDWLLSTQKGQKVAVSDAETRVMHRRFADIELTLMGANPQLFSPEQHELILRWLDALHRRAAFMVATGERSEWDPGLYEGIVEHLDQHREEWDRGLSAIVERQMAEQQE